MPAAATLSEARAVFGADVLGPDELGQAFAAEPAALQLPIPFTCEELRRAQLHGHMLVLRAGATDAHAPLTILRILERHPDAFDTKFLRQMGYQLKDDWGIELEPLAATDTCAPGWALTCKNIIDATRNRAYDEQTAAMKAYAKHAGMRPAALRRRSAVEIVYDTLLYFTARGVRLLEQSWDWSGSATIDGGYLNVGGFGANGLQILSFSRAVRHGGLGVCPTWQPIE